MDSEATPDQLRIALIVSSVRSGRTADVVLDWLLEQVKPVPWLDLDVVDLANVDLPMHELRPGAGAYVSDRLTAADGFLVLTPEYNHSFPAPLKNFIDWHYDEWSYKPVAFVAYGAGSGGLRAIEQLRLIFPELHATTARNAVMLRAPWQHLTADGRFEPGPDAEAALTATLDELRWWSLSLRDGRAAHEVPA